MATYDDGLTQIDLPIELDAQRTPIPGAAVDLADDGSVRAQSFFSVTTYRFRVKHRYISQAEAVALAVFCNTNRAAQFTLDYKDDDGDGLTLYDVILDERGEDIRHTRGPYWQADIYLIGRKQ